MRVNKLILAALCCFLLAGALMVSNMRAQDREILSLRRRIHNLEVIINYEIRAGQTEVSRDEK